MSGIESVAKSLNCNMSKSVNVPSDTVLKNNVYITIAARIGDLW